MTAAPTVLDLLLHTGVPALVFAFAMVSTPGPANMTCMASGAAVGYGRTVPFILGLMAGFQALALVIAAGLGEVLRQAPALMLGMKLASAGYILWLAYRIATAPVEGDRPPARPVGFWQGVVLHPLNPKAWAMLLSAYGHFIEPAAPYGPQAAMVMLAFLVVGLPLQSAWTVAGQGMRTLVHRPDRMRTLNVTMAVVMVAVVGAALVL